MLLRLLVLAVAPLLAHGAPHADAIHAHMEPAPPKADLPRVSSPVVGDRMRRVGLLAKLASPKSALLMLPAAIAGLALAYPEPMARFFLHVLCFLGSLFEPFDSVLPQKHPLRVFIAQVQDARRAYEVKHGLVGMRDPMHFFDEDDVPKEDEDEAAEPEATADGEEEDGADEGDSD